MVTSANIPLCVDLDGSLVKNDLFIAAYLGLLRKNFLANLKLLLAWPLQGRAAFKALVGARAKIDVTAIDFNAALLQFLIAEHQAGRSIILVTANDQKIAQQVADYLGFFSSVMASDGLINLKGNNKAKALVECYGKGGFDYIGNDYCDVPVWKQARKVYVVAKTPDLIDAISKKTKVDKVFSG